MSGPIAHVVIDRSATSGPELAIQEVPMVKPDKTVPVSYSRCAPWRAAFSRRLRKGLAAAMGVLVAPATAYAAWELVDTFEHEVACRLHKVGQDIYVATRENLEGTAPAQHIRLYLDEANRKLQNRGPVDEGMNARLDGLLAVRGGYGYKSASRGV